MAHYDLFETPTVGKLSYGQVPFPVISYLVYLILGTVGVWSGAHARQPSKTKLYASSILAFATFAIAGKLLMVINITGFVGACLIVAAMCGAGLYGAKQPNKAFCLSLIWSSIIMVRLSYTLVAALGKEGIQNNNVLASCLQILVVLCVSILLLLGITSDSSLFQRLICCYTGSYTTAAAVSCLVGFYEAPLHEFNSPIDAYSLLTSPVKFRWSSLYSLLMLLLWGCLTLSSFVVATRREFQKGPSKGFNIEFVLGKISDFADRYNLIQISMPKGLSANFCLPSVTENCTISEKDTKPNKIREGHVDFLEEDEFVINEVFSNGGPLETGLADRSTVDALDGIFFSGCNSDESRETSNCSVPSDPSPIFQRVFESVTKYNHSKTKDPSDTAQLIDFWSGEDHDGMSVYPGV